MPFVTAESLRASLYALWGTADHMLKIWFVLKQMGMSVDGRPVAVTTSSPTPSLVRLFGYGDTDRKFFVPFAHTRRFATMQSDAARSIIQTNIKRWQESGSVVRTDPTGYLDFEEGEGQAILARPGRKYPLGLGHGLKGFALNDESRVAIPDVAFAVWYGRQTEIPAEEEPSMYLLRFMRESLKMSPVEEAAIFIRDARSVAVQPQQLSDREIFEIVTGFLGAGVEPTVELVQESFADHSRRIKGMVTNIDSPPWLRKDPADVLREVIEGGSKAILLYGPPRTGKTRAVDLLMARDDARRETIQIHDGWGYDELMMGLRPEPKGGWDWVPGALAESLANGKKLIVLEEINRTNVSQALGEAFSLLEDTYRGKANAIRLRSGGLFFIPEDVVLIATMNTLDKSTEDIDDALLGRLAAVEFNPRVEALVSMLAEQGVDEAVGTKIRELFVAVLEHYPLGHGYLAQLRPGADPIAYYLTRIRPVLQAQLARHRDAELQAIDNKVDQLFS